MKTTLLLKWRKLIPLLLFITLLYSCNQEHEADVSPLASSQTANRIGAMKKAFHSEGYDSQLNEAFNDTSKVYWEPSWQGAKLQTIGDSVSYYYISLTPKLLNAQTGAFISSVNTPNKQRFILIKENSEEAKFYLADYIRERDKNDEDAPKAHTDFEDFSGTVRLKDLESHQKSVIRYINGSPVSDSNNKAANKQTMSTGTMGVTAEVCYMITECTWVQMCNGIPNILYNVGEYSCPYPDPWDSDCYGGWTNTYTEQDMICEEIPEEPPLPPGGSGGGFPGPYNNPCDQVNKLQKNQGFMDKMNDLKSKVTLPNEFGYLIQATNTGYTYTSIIGQPGAPEIVFSVPGPLDGLIHSHYQGLLPTFSGSDLRAIYTLQAAGVVRDLSTFVMGLSAPNGHQFLMIVDDQAKWNAFAARWLATDFDFLNFEAQYNLAIGAMLKRWPSSPDYAKQNAFLEITKDAGVKIFQSYGDEFFYRNVAVGGEYYNECK